VLEDAELRAGLDELRATGVRIGFSATGARQAATIERALEVGGFDAVQATWNLLEPSAGAALERAHDAGLGVIVKEALANGRLTDRGDEPAVVEAADALDTTPDALALAAVLARPWVDVVLSGASTVEQLKSNLQATDVALDDAALGDLAEAPDAYWEARSELAWT
jgi:aryl-alcohol dehydrogenase-like predicted oxidoreductase